MDKYALGDEVRTLPSGYMDFLDVALPSAPAEPADVEVAQKKVGQCADYIVQILNAYAGLHLLKVPYYMGEGNKAVLGLLLGRLQQSPNYADFEILEPVDGVSYAVGENSVTIQITAGNVDGVNVSCSVYDPNQAGSVIADFTQENDTYYAPLTYTEVGTWSLTFVVTWPSGAIKSRQVEVTVQ